MMHGSWPPLFCPLPLLDPIDLGIAAVDIGEAAFGGADAAAAAGGIGAAGAADAAAGIAGAGIGADVGAGIAAGDAAIPAAVDASGAAIAPGAADAAMGGAGAVPGGGLPGVDAAMGATTPVAGGSPIGAPMGLGMGGAEVSPAIDSGMAGWEPTVTPAADLSAGGVMSDAAVGGGSGGLDTTAASSVGGGAGVDAGGLSTADAALGGGALQEAVMADPTAAASGGGMLDTIKGYMPSVKTLGAGVGLAGLGYQMLRGDKLPKQDARAEALSRQEAAIGKQEMAMGQAGKITPGEQAQIDAFKQAAQAQLYQLYSSGGRDPRQSTDFMTAMQNVEQQAIQMYWKFVQGHLDEGLKYGGQASSGLQAIAKDQIAMDQGFGQAVGRAAAAMSGGGMTIKL